MFTPLHVLCNSNRITLWQMVICGIPSFRFKDFLFSSIPVLYILKKVSVFLSPWRFDSRSPSGFVADLCEGPDKAEQGLVMQARGSTGEIICEGVHWLHSPILLIPQKNIETTVLHVYILNNHFHTYGPHWCFVQTMQTFTIKNFPKSAAVFNKLGIILIFFLFLINQTLK